ncbi:MAG: hypothetical protein Q4D41_08155 [Prevotellaceae bacterium]|nr:hypothetical protein [Prevotellaceae bacterium]
MIGLKETIEKFALSDKSRDEILNGGIDAPFEFEQVAKVVLAGHIIVACGNEQVVIHPTCVEFYYHEEFDRGIKDLIVYHRNPKDNKKKKEIFNLGILHNHVSGIDITFEGGTCPDNAVRASLLIREFEINGELEKRPTRIYEALFSQFSIFDGFSVK